MTNLNEVEIRDLIGRYESELKKLTYQSSKVAATIAELKAHINGNGVKHVQEPVKPTVQKAVVKEKPKTKRPAMVHPEGVYTGTFSNSSIIQKKLKKEPTISAKKGNSTVVEVLKNAGGEFDLPENGNGYRLSEWDHFILDSLDGAKMTLVNSDFFKLAAARVKEHGLEMTKSQLHGKINRSIHKLTHKRELIVKVTFSGKGFAYAHKDWFDSNGKLLLRYKRKSIR